MAAIAKAPSPLAGTTSTIDLKTSENVKTSKKPQISPVLSLISGGVAGGVEATITYPFEFAKTRTQLSSTKASGNPLAVIAQVARQDGIRSIYTGCSTLILGTTFKAGVRFLSYDTIRNMLMDDAGRLSPARGMLAGMIAGAFESIIAVTPTERLKTALIDDAKSGTRRFRGGTHALTTMIREQGIGEVYRGLASTTMKQSATSAVRMGSYNVIKEFSKQHNVPQNTATTFISGAVAGVITVYATQPFDSIKTVAQGAKGASTGEAFRQILTQRGIRGFWSGSTMRLGRLVLSGGIVFSVYEQVSAVLVGFISSRS
ncbi:mitochondrial carrier domain-containing protein [Plectosphaerella plurivora]|uniref:Mitochondrial carrier domain-containing protein n=1 Tax=Plectosphaerella plurivora TaxID=936078 RepID=A0A9P9A982_9PEZI|nr:mitochondrial carrier domain-containing protein [Plectosphaerella plurivora]